METQPQKPKQGMNVFVAIFGMIVTFALGVYIGLHPLWIPIDLSGDNQRPGAGSPTMHTSEDRPATTTATAAASQV